MYYSAQTGGFYDPAIHGDNIPTDAVEITNELRIAFLAGESQGKRIIANESGFPELHDAPISEPQIPQVITIRQAKLVLLEAGLLDDVDAAVAQADRTTRIEWEYATEIKRDWPTLLVMQSALNLTDAQVDQLFIDGAML